MSSDERSYLQKSIDMHRHRFGREPTLQEMGSNFALMGEHKRAAVLDTIQAESANEISGDDTASLVSAGKRMRIVQELRRTHELLRKVGR
jgi:hypothetical protein